MEAKELRRIARENLQSNWGLSTGVAAVACLLGGLLLGSSFLPEITYKTETDAASLSGAIDQLATHISSIGNFTFSLSALGIIQLILGGVLQLGYCKYLLKQYDKAEYSFQDLFSQFDRFDQGFAQKFLRTLYSWLWGLLLIIPGIVKSYSYAMTPYIMAENPEMTASEAIKVSMELMNGHKGELFWLDLTFIGWDILANFTLGLNNVSIKFALGHLALNPYKNAARTAFYRNLTRPNPELFEHASPEF